MKKANIFSVNGVDHRIIRRQRKEYMEGYLDPFDIDEHVLQRKRDGLWGLISPWIDVETEIIPSYVSISFGIFGDTGGWTSRFLERYPEAFVRAI